MARLVIPNPGGVLTEKNISDINAMFTDLYNGGAVGTVASGDLIVGNGSNVGTVVALSGDATLANTGALTVNPATVGGVASVSLTAAQIITLHSVPVTIVAAPGAGKALIFEDLTFSFTYGSVQMTGGSTTSLQYHGASTNLMDTTIAAAAITSAANFAGSYSQATTASGVIVVGNAALELITASSDFAAGDSTAKVTCRYRVITL